MNWYYDYNYQAARAYAFAEKQRETADYKKLLFTLAMSVIAVTVVVQIAATVAFTLLPVSQSHPSHDIFILAIDASGFFIPGEDFAYFLMWLINDVVMYVPALVIFGFVFLNRLEYHRPGTPYQFKMHWVIPLFLAGYTLAVSSSALTNLVAVFFSTLFGDGGGLPDVFSEVMPVSGTQMLVMFFTVGVVAPVCEEIIYRYLLLKPLRRYGDWQAIVITSLLFGFFHGNLSQFFYTAVMGFLLGVTAVRANSVLPAIVIHMLNNVFVIFNSFFRESGGTSANLDEAWFTAINIIVIALGAAALIFMSIKGYFSVDNNNPHLSPSERKKIIATRPSLIVLVILLTIITLLGTLL